MDLSAGNVTPKRFRLFLCWKVHEVSNWKVWPPERLASATRVLLPVGKWLAVFIFWNVADSFKALSFDDERLVDAFNDVHSGSATSISLQSTEETMQKQHPKTQILFDRDRFFHHRLHNFSVLFFLLTSVICAWIILKISLEPETQKSVWVTMEEIVAEPNSLSICT